MHETIILAGPDPRQLYVRFGRLFIDISGLVCSFGLTLRVVLESDVVLQWITAGPSRLRAPSARSLWGGLPGTFNLVVRIL